MLQRLRQRFPLPNKPRLDPLDELVLTILSQSTTDANRDRAWATLAKRFPAREAVVGAPGAGRTPARGETRGGRIWWEGVRRSAPAELEAAIRVAGLGRQKAEAIRGALERLTNEVGRPTLDHLESMNDEDALAYLTTFKGVGVKTAACVLCFALRRPVLPVDTHVHRIARRLGWIPPSATATRAHGLLARHVPAPDRFRMHMLLITLGREICKARNPRCGACPLAPKCPKVGVEL